MPTKVAQSSTMMQFEEEVVERRLSFKPDPDLGGLCMGVINDVRLNYREAPLLDDKGVENTWEYAGLKVPTLFIEFKQCVTDSNPKDRYVVYTVSPVTTIDKHGKSVDTDQIISIIRQNYDRLRHIANAFKGTKGYPTDLGTCPGIDFAATPKDRCEQYAKFFEYFKTLLIGKDEKSPNYKGVKLWIKIVADYRTRKFYSIPGFVNRGFIERVIAGQNTTLEFDPNESIHLIKEDEKKTREVSATSVPTSSANEVNMTPEAKAILDKYK